MESVKKKRALRKDFADMQRDFVLHLVRDGTSQTEAARRAGYSHPAVSACDLMKTTGIIAKIRQERNKLYQTELATTAVRTLKAVMLDSEAPASARVSAARTSLELAGDIGKHAQANKNHERSLAEMTPEELASIIDRWEGERVKVAKDITPEDSQSSIESKQTVVDVQDIDMIEEQAA
jgi:phage terminase small subunit